MALEIERKFLVDPNWKQLSQPHAFFLIKQAYVFSDLNQSLRIRFIDDKESYINLKIRINNISRHEYEYEIPFKDALEIYHGLSDNKKLEKTRYLVWDEHLSSNWEVDVFNGNNDGLIVAEIELKNENQFVMTPVWIKQEITNDPLYLNSNLVKNPYKNW